MSENKEPELGLIPLLIICLGCFMLGMNFVISMIKLGFTGKGVVLGVVGSILLVGSSILSTKIHDHR